MKIEVNITKKYFFTLLSIFIIFTAGIFVYAYIEDPTRPVPNPGHSISETQGYFTGDSNLRTSLGKFCQTDGTNCPSQQSQTQYTRYEEYTLPGTYTWTVPAGVSKIKVTAVGAGGGGGTGTPVRGGGSGGVSISTLTVTPGSTHTIVVGNGGGMPGTGSHRGITGEKSSFDSTSITLAVIANGAQGGDPSGAGAGAPIAGAVGNLTYAGNPGTDSYGGNTLFGGHGGNIAVLADRGGGGYYTGSINSGGDGLVRIDY